MNTTAPDYGWPTAYKVAFGRVIPADEQQAWDDRLCGAAPNVTAQEIMRAIDELSNDAIKHPSKYAPTANDIVSAIRKARWQAKQASAMPGQSCALCSHGEPEASGWMTIYSASCVGQPVTECDREAPGARPISVPCKCSKGQEVARKIRDKKPMDPALRALMSGNYDAEEWRG